MQTAYLAAGLLWFVIFVYAVAGSVDFGATFWKMFFAHRGLADAETIAAKYVSPIWEVTNVFLVLIDVGLVGFFPHAAYAYGTVLLGPGGVLLILLALRGAFLSYSYASHSYKRSVMYVSGATALLIPALLVSVLPISQGGFITGPANALRLDLGALLSDPTVYAYIIFGLAAELFISATFLSDYALTAGNVTAYTEFRRQALRFGPVMIIAAVAALFIIPTEPWLQDRLHAQWPWFLASLAAFAAGYSAFWWERGAGQPLGRPRWAVLLVGLQLALADIGYGLAHAPYLLYPYVTTVGGFTNQAMFGALLWVVVIGLAVLTPAFVWLWRLFILDKGYTKG